MNCSRCGAPMNVVKGQTYLHCEYCGGYDFPDPNRDGVVLLDEAAPYDCPVCKQTLVLASVNEVRIYSCANCKGNLINQEVLLLILRLTEPRNWVGDLPAEALDRSELSRKLSCPSCKKIMEAYPYGGAGNIIIEGCYKCKFIWLDYGELSRVIRSYLQIYDHPSGEQGAKKRSILF
ncbi:MAG: zf-TFIIB domain-containing protein [Anaerolineae bacterium]|nr:zf-TFIIB domain-containing protein [Anaerolineae bacterium]